MPPSRTFSMSSSSSSEGGRDFAMTMSSSSDGIVEWQKKKAALTEDTGCLPWVAPRGKQLKLLSIFGVLATATNFPEGYCNSYPNTAHDEFELMINRSYIGRGDPDGMSQSNFTWYWSLMLNVWFVGYLGGTFVTPYLTDNLGRRRSLLIANCIALLGNTLSFIAVIFGQPEVLMISRVIASLSSGISFGSMIMFLQEATPTEQRGATSFLCESTFIATMALGIGAGMDQVFGRNLPVLTGVAIIPAIISIIIIIPLYETPKYLLINCSNRDDALKSLIFYRGFREDHEETLDEMMLEKQMGDKEEKVGMFQGMKEVMSEGHLRMAFFMGAAALQIIVGIWPITYLSTDLLEANFDPTTSQMASLAFMVADFIASIGGMMIIEKFNRRVLLLSLGVANTLSLVLYVVADLLIPVWAPSRWGQIIALILFGITYGIALGPIAFFITSELVPQRSRAVVQSMVFAFNTIMNFIFSFITLPLYNQFGPISFLFLLVIPSIGCIIFLFFVLPETRGREVHEVVDELVARFNKNAIGRGVSTDHLRERNISIRSLSRMSITAPDSVPKDSSA